MPLAWAARSVGREAEREREAPSIDCVKSNERRIRVEIVSLER